MPAASDTRRALIAAAGALAVAALAAIVTRAAFAGRVRAALDFGFGGVPSRFDEAVDIFLNNARLIGAVAAATLIVRSAGVGGDARDADPVGRGLRLAADLSLGAAVAINCALVGAAVGAYGTRMVSAMLPHGPLELAGYSLALALYLRARESRLELAPALRLTGWAMALLATAALVETYAP
jgi:hypothetical protein